MPLKLLKDLFALSKNQDALKLLNNIVIAALHLACMFKGTADRDDRLVKFVIPSEHDHLSTLTKLGHSKFTLGAQAMVTLNLTPAMVY